MTPDPNGGNMDTSPAAPAEAPDAELVEFLGGEVSSDAPARESTAPAPAAQPDAPDAAQQRDEQGRFTKGEAVAATPEPASTETLEVAPPEPTPSKPFVYRAYGAEHSPFTGATETDEGVVFPKEAVPQLRQILAEGHGAESRRRQSERERETKLTSARSANAQITQQADMTLRRLAELRRSPEALQQFFADLDRNWQVLDAEIRAEALQKQLDAQRESGERQAQERHAEALRPYMRQRLEQDVGQIIASEAELKGLDGAKMAERLWGSFFNRVFREADQDDPNGQYRRGEVLIDYDAIRQELKYEASLRRSGAPTAPAPVKPKVAVQTPPVVTAKGAGARPAPKIPKFANTQEADDWFESGGYNELG